MNTETSLSLSKLKHQRKSAIIFGTGSMARVMLSFVCSNHSISAFCADDEFVKPDVFKFMGLPLVPYSSIVAVPVASYDVFMAVGYHQMNKVRAARYTELRELGYSVNGYVHHDFFLHNGVTLENACVIYDNVAIHPGSTVGQNVFISSNVSVGHDCKIGAHSWINSGVSLAGGVEIGNRCVLGVNSCVVQGVRLGEGTFVGANALVTEDTAPGSVVVAERGVRINMDSERFLKLTKAI